MERKKMRHKGLLTLFLIMLLVFPTAASAKLAPGDFIDTYKHWAASEIQTAYDLGLMKGTGVTAQGFKVFTPEGKVTRSQMASVLVRTFDLDYGNIRFIKQPLASDYYRDVNDQAWYAGDVVLTAVNQIFRDIESRNFYPETPVTRIELASAIYRSFNAKGVSIPMIMMMPNYEDMQGFDSDSMNAMVFVNNTGIMKGEGKYFRPGAPVTRAELATVLVRCKNTLALNQGVEDPQSTNGYRVNRLIDVGYTDTMETDINIPVIEGLADTRVQTAINDQLNQDVMRFKNEVASQLDEYVKNAEIGGYPIHPFATVSRFTLGYQDSKLLSLYVDCYQYTGGAHGGTVRKGYTWNMETGQELALKDIFESGYDYQAVIDQYVREQISADPDIYFTGDMGFTGIKADHGYYVQNGHLVLYFQQYDIAPYAAGIREFYIPLSEFGDRCLLFQ